MDEELSYRARTCRVELCGPRMCGRNPAFGQIYLLPVGILAVM